jgi:hypothetical protein
VIRERKINFQPDTTPLDGYLKDDGDQYGDRSNGYTYGWVGGAQRETRDRDDGSTDERNETLNHFVDSAPEAYDVSTDEHWALNGTNGTYTVTIVGGDPNHNDQNMTFRVEGTVLLDDSFDEGTNTNSERFERHERTIEVSDGRLDVVPPDGTYNPKSNWIVVEDTESGRS